MFRFGGVCYRSALQEGSPLMRRYKRSTRVADLIRMEVADIIQNRLKDPRIGFITITDVRLSDDLKNAMIFLSVLDKSHTEATLEALNHSIGFVRTELGHRLRLRLVPTIAFRIDDCVERGYRIDDLLRGISKDDHEDTT